MAILVPGRSLCSICEGVIESDQDIVATSGCAFPPDHELWRHCDAGMHWGCFWSWPQREEFSRGYVQSSLHGYAKVYAAVEVYRDADGVVMIEPAKRSLKLEEAGASEDPRIHVWLWSTNMEYSVLSSEWVEWLTEPVCRPELKPVLEALKSRLSSLYPQASGLLEGVNIEAQVDKQQAFVLEVFGKSRRQMEEREQFLREQNEGLDSFCRQCPNCPHCGAPWEMMRYYDLREKGRRSCMICQDCARSSHLEDYMGKAVK